MNNTKQHILRDIIAKCDFGLKIPKLCLYIIEYKTNPIRNLYKAFKKAKTYLNILNAKTIMQRELELKSGYEPF